MADKLRIVNRALQRIGAKKLANLTENSRERLSVDAAYDDVVLQELMTNMWTFAIKRVEITADVTGPDFGRTYQFTKPDDFLRVAPFDPSQTALIREYLVEGNKILSDYAGPLQLRYVSDLSDEADPEALFHPLFANAVSMRLALEIAEELTGSSSKQDRLEGAYTFFVNKARATDGIETGPIMPEVDEFVAVRTNHGVDPSLRKYS